MILRAGLMSVLVVSVAPVWAQTSDEAPLSAIDWLSQSVEQPETAALGEPERGTQATRTPSADEDPVANSASTPDVSVQPLGGSAPRVLGLLSPAATGLPADIWQNSDLDTLAALLMAQEVDTLPALQDLLITLAVTQANPPREAANAGGFFVARVDKLLDFGALEAAQAMLEAANPDTPQLFRRWFDVSLLTGTEDAACRALRTTPDVAPTPSARVFCLARSGDWSAAALTLNTGRALGDIDEDTADLLSRFLDPDLYEGEPPLARAARPTPLIFRMFEAIGDPLNTGSLPRAFAQSDLRDNVGLKAQLEAAERLAQAGAIDPNVLVGLYTARTPSASGGVWERSRAVQRLERALSEANPEDTADAINDVWVKSQRGAILVPVMRVYGADLLEADVDDRGRRNLFNLLLLSSEYESAALIDDLAEIDPFLAAVARGDPSEALAIRPDYPLIRTAFGAEPNPDLVAMASEGRMGEAILRTVATIQQGLDRDQMAYAEGIATLRALGLEDIARRAALQTLLLR